MEFAGRRGPPVTVDTVETADEVAGRALDKQDVLDPVGEVVDGGRRAGNSEESADCFAGSEKCR